MTKDLSRGRKNNQDSIAQTRASPIPWSSPPQNQEMVSWIPSWRRMVWFPWYMKLLRENSTPVAASVQGLKGLLMAGLSPTHLPGLYWIYFYSLFFIFFFSYPALRKIAWIIILSPVLLLSNNQSQSGKPSVRSGSSMFCVTHTCSNARVFLIC